jgi:hypothetical protein
MHPFKVPVAPVSFISDFIVYNPITLIMNVFRPIWSFPVVRISTAPHPPGIQLSQNVTISLIKTKAAARGLHRSISDASPYLFHSLLKCKAEEAGIRYVEVDPIKHKPSQTCSLSAQRLKKSLSQRSHRLPDGSLISRDLNSARVILLISLGWHASPTGWEPYPVPDAADTSASSHETASILLRS